MEERERLQARNRRGRDRRPAALLSSSDGRDPRFDGDGMDVDRAMSSVSQVSGAEDFDLGFEEEDEVRPLCGTSLSVECFGSPYESVYVFFSMCLSAYR